ncbi:MAG: thiol:disulfide interchange protein [Flavobacteriia bacterium]|nr:MAG: thiol:disulfide interchange protein [Flavobacteriia bacterium]
MKKILSFMFIAVVIFSCAKEENDKMYVKGEVSGLKKGKFYLQKQKDSVFVTVDSVMVNGTDTFILTDKVESPEIYFLKMSRSDKKIPFFGENDTIVIKTSLDKFSYLYKIKGSENQERLEKFKETYKKFNGKDLDLIKARFDAAARKDTDSVKKIEDLREKLLRRKYLYAINFAINNSDHEVAPYIALTELNYAKTKWLDSIYNSLTPDIKDSKYGKSLQEFIVRIKVAEE